MTAPIVHIGFHKTATSWFQQSVYPLLTSHRMIDRDLIRATFVDGDAFSFDPATARAALGLDAPGLPPLLCEEELSGILHIGAASTFIAKDVATRVHAALPDAHIVIFVRAQVAAAASWYMQYLKEGGTASARRYFFPDDYLFPGRLMHFKMARFDFAQLDYRGLVEHYDRVFGRERVHVYAYEDLRRDSLKTVETMRRDLGFTLGSLDVSMSRVNRAYRRGLIPVARGLNLLSARGVANKRTLVHLPFGYRGARFILDHLNKVALFGRGAGPKQLIDPPTARWIEQRFAASNRWLAQRTGRDLGALGYAVEQPTTPAAAPTRSSLLRWMRK